MGYVSLSDSVANRRYNHYFAAGLGLASLALVCTTYACQADAQTSNGFRRETNADPSGASAPVPSPSSRRPSPPLAVPVVPTRASDADSPAVSTIAPSTPSSPLVPITATTAESQLMPPNRSPMPWILLGIGGAGLAVGAFTGVLAMSSHATLAERCPAAYCPPAERDDLASYHTLGAISTTGFIVGGVSMVASVVWFLTQTKSEHTATRGIHRTEPEDEATRPMIFPSALGILGRF